jgi:hypothetical protein
MILFLEEDGMCTMAGAGNGYEQSSSEICHTGKSFFNAWYTGSGAQPYFEGIRIRPHGARQQPGRNLLYVRRIAADLHGRGTPPAGSPLNQCLEHFDVQGILSSRGGMGKTETLKTFAKKTRRNPMTKEEHEK